MKIGILHHQEEEEEGAVGGDIETTCRLSIRNLVLVPRQEQYRDKMKNHRIILYFLVIYQPMTEPLR
jgi:hypothetical protein